MPIRIGWGNAEQTRVYVQFIGLWTWEEFDSALGDIRKQITMADADRLSILFNLADTRRVPDQSLTYLTELIGQWKPDGSLIVLVGMPFLLANVLKIIKQVFPRKFLHIHILETMDEAEALFQKHGF